MQLQIPPGDALHIALFQRSHTEKHSEKIYQKTCSISNLTLAPLKKNMPFSNIYFSWITIWPKSSHLVKYSKSKLMLRNGVATWKSLGISYTHSTSLSHRFPHSLTEFKQFLNKSNTSTKSKNRHVHLMRSHHSTSESFQFTHQVVLKIR